MKTKRVEADLAIAEAAIKVIDDGIKLLPEDALAEWVSSANKDVTIAEAIETAKKELEKPLSEDNPLEEMLFGEKRAMLIAYAVQEANRMASTLWRLELLTDDIEKEYRELPSLGVVAEAYNDFLAGRQQRSDEITEMGNEVQTEKRDLDIFMGIINGVPVEESERRYDEFKNAQRQALAGGR